MVKTKKLLGLWAVLMLTGSLASCTVEMETDEIDFESGIRLTVIHTGDIHSRLLPYDMDLNATDERIGMVQANEPFGGIARAATVIREIRAKAQHSVHVDSGDVFQGAPIFNEYNGEAEVLALNYIGMDAFIIGNHEFDDGVANLYDKMSKAQFAVLAANYQWKPSQGNEFLPLKDVARPYTIVNADGVRVAVIGMANYSSMSSSTYGDNSLGITVLENVQVVQSYINALKNDANVITMVTHLGLGEDEDVIRKTTGLDIVFGGHLHVVLNPPKVIPDASVNLAGEHDPKMVPLVHSGAFMKYVGHFDAVFYPDYIVRPEHYPEGPSREWDLTLVSHKFDPIPIESTLAEDAELSFLMAPYERELARRLNLRHIVGYAPQTLKRFGTGGNDSSLGNFLADNLVMRQRVEADFGATNSLGIRTDINQGPVTNDQLYNVFPFPNTVASMTLSGSEVWSLLDYNSYRSMNRGCQSQLQVSGVRYTLDCHTAKRVVDDYLDMGYLFEYQYRVDAFQRLCEPCKQGMDNPQCPDYCMLDYEDKDNPQNNIFNVHFARDIEFVRGSCETTADCPFHEDGISECRTITDSDRGPYQACIEKMQPQWFYKFATNNYMAHGGSGFSSLKYNTTQMDTGVSLREILIDGIEKQNSCVERCEREFAEVGKTFDINNPGACIRLKTCREDTIEFETRWCKHMYKYSEQEVCLANFDDTGNYTGPTQCVGLDKTTDYENCLNTNYNRLCGDRYYESKIRACMEEAEFMEQKCQGVGNDSVYSRCVAQYADRYPQCMSLSNVSEYDECVASATAKAEELCMGVSCFIASTDGRQYPVRPHNDELGESVNSFNNGVAIMEALQEAGYDACY